jgi:hypothetical protein
VNGVLVSGSPGETDGTVIRWYLKTTPNSRDLIASASRRHVRFHREDLPLPASVVDAARAAHRELHANPQADIRHYLTPRSEVTG